jgi:hypothetical protein
MLPLDAGQAADDNPRLFGVSAVFSPLAVRSRTRAQFLDYFAQTP